jgi:hypothetical protein
VEFLGYIFYGDGIHKVQTIMDWATLASIQNVQYFLKFTNFYRRFIAHYYTIVTAITSLTQKDQPFS